MRFFLIQVVYIDRNIKRINFTIEKVIIKEDFHMEEQKKNKNELNEEDLNQVTGGATRAQKETDSSAKEEQKKWWEFWK